MGIRTSATILREIQQAKAAPIKQHLKERIVADLEIELEAMFAPSKQLELPGVPGAIEDARATPPVAPARGSKG